MATVAAGLIVLPAPAFADLCRTNPDACGPKPQPPPTPSVVANLTVSAVTQTQATLNWQDTSANEDSFTIIRWKYVAGRPEGSTVTLPAHPGTGPMTWTDAGLEPNTNYQWFVASTLSGNWHTPSPYVSTWTLGPLIPPGTPAAAQLTAFENDNTAGVFPHLDKAAIVSDLVRIVDDPLDTVDQSYYTGLCGPAAIEVALARRNPAALVNWVRSIYETGQFQAGTALYSASPDLRNSGAHANVTPANWLFMATIRDAGNSTMRITDQTPADSVAWSTMPGEEAAWMHNILGLNNVASYTGSPFTTIGTYVNRASSYLAAGGVAILLVDSSLVGNPPGLVAYPNHYVDLISWNPNSPDDTFTVVTWGTVKTITVPWQTFNADTFAVFMAD